MLWGLFWVNFLGTIYGYMWYGDQLAYTLDNNPEWMLPFVPDSPTASLFFTAVIGFLLFDNRRRYSYGTQKKTVHPVRAFIEAFALVTSFKYGIWAVTMIFAAAAKGDVTTWKDWMLVVSHLGMAVEALLYVSFYRFGYGALAVVALWALGNDYMDYGQGVFPWLPQRLLDDLRTICKFTVIMSIVSLGIALVSIIWRRNRV
ncbi:DUF1405 domain-containing protein [Paenibacillus thalictri]|uniref:DUF1405 domain-containing protein n=2 Tax=Paenibacillus thalictri TaxID=2527873 RepID=A0A4Q9DW21_9BACL|nr:DUF1405 domain-containing protein [Paenibacillus thalictri]TBL80003.1 DUF1405 domain-containing protein [Paenibacillus thalictri]